MYFGQFSIEVSVVPGTNTWALNPKDNNTPALIGDAGNAHTRTCNFPTHYRVNDETELTPF
jgi:hypothetical protein